MTNPFLLDDETTWPPQILRILEEGLPICRAYFAEEKQITHRLSQSPLPLRRILNTNKLAYDALMRDVEFAAKSEAIIGWHCTRLCEDEIRQIKNGGMLPLSSHSLEMRIRRRASKGDFTPEIAERLLSENQASDPNRQMLWFLLSQDLLRDASGVQRFFASWGGEALYNSHERDVNTGPILRRIGVPAIIEVAIALSEACTFDALSVWLSRSFLSRRGISDGHDPHREIYVVNPIKPEAVLRIVKSDEPAFLDLAYHQY